MHADESSDQPRSRGRLLTEHLSPTELQRAAHLIKKGALVAFPTETVYGLGAAIFNPSAIELIFKVKRRPMDNPLIAHVSSFEQVDQIAVEIPDSFHLLARSFFPGPLTVVLKRNEKVPSIVSAGLASIALRMPAHPVALKLISLVGEPLVAPSANLSGKPSSTHERHVLEDFEGKIAAVIKGGKTDFGIESTVVSLLDETPTLLRPGAIVKEQIEQVLGKTIAVPPSDRGLVLSPGMKHRHYTPKAAVKLFQTFEAIKNYLNEFPSSLPRMTLSLRHFPTELQGVDPYLLSVKEFYSLLRFADQKKYQEILVLCDQELQSQTALMNRLLRSSEER
jgi:L-threonylcarbamoyladenylate synthase